MTRLEGEGGDRSRSQREGYKKVAEAKKDKGARVGCDE